MNSTRLSALCDKILETSWLLAVIVTPLFFNVYSSRVFEPDKLTTLRTLAVIMAAAWLVKLIEERVSGHQTLGFTWRTPLVLPTFFMVVVYLLSTALSITPWVSLMGSYQRLQGTYTTLSYVTLFLVILQSLRTRAQLDRLVNVIIINSLPIALYGLIQHNRLDPLPWGGDVTQRVTSNMGNAIFVAAYLVMILPLTVGRIIESFRTLLADEKTDWANIGRAAGYVFIAAVELITIWYAQSRGPLLGLIAGSYFLLLLLTLSLRTKIGAIGSLTIIAMTVLVVGFLAIVNIPGGPLQSIQQAPWLGRMGSVFDFEEGSGKVRALIWEGMADLILPHKPIKQAPTMAHPEGKADPFNFLRPLVGYGPESVYVAYNRFYPPLLGHYESRTASPDRSHNETLDSLAITGILGFIAYLSVFGSTFYYSLKWLGFVQDKKQRNILIGLTTGISLTSIAFFWLWQGLGFFGAALTFGIIAALGIYLGIIALIAIIHRLRKNEDILPSLPYQNVLLISLFAAIVAHFVEINFGIAIASTRTTFWAYAALLVLIGLNRIPHAQQPEHIPSKEVRHKSRKKARRKLPASTTQTYVPGWLGATLAMALIGGFILGTLAFDFITNADRLDSPAQIIWRALTTLPNRNASTCTAVWNPLVGKCRSGGALMIVSITWVMSAVIFVSQQANQGLFRQHKGDGLLASAVYLFTSLAIGLGFALVLTGQQAAMLNIHPQSMMEVINLADRVARFLTDYYWFIIFVLVAGGVALAAKEFRTAKAGAHPWGIIASIVVTILAGVITVGTNLRPIQADMIYKQADPYEKQNQWLVAIEHYKHAIELVPREDFYYLYLGRASLEYASMLDDKAVQDAVMRETEQVLLRAREINPLNTDHSANLARMYRRWADMSSDETTRNIFLQQSSRNYEIATSLSPQNTILWNEWAMLYFFGLGDVESYQRTLEHSLELDSGFDQTWMMCGDVNRQRGALDEAVACYKQALELSPKALQVWIALGETYRAMEKWDDAIAALEHALELSPSSGNVWRALADTHIGAQRWNEAIAALEQVVTLEQNASDLWNIYSLLSQLYAQTGRSSQAIVYANRALESAPENQRPALEDLLAQLQSAGTPEE